MTCTCGARRASVDRQRLQPWRIDSFSSLRSNERDAQEHDRTDPTLPRPLVAAVPARGIFAFARGARAGVCLHEILERSDFSRPQDPVAIERTRVKIFA